MRSQQPSRTFFAPSGSFLTNSALARPARALQQPPAQRCSGSEDAFAALGEDSLVQTVAKQDTSGAPAVTPRAFSQRARIGLKEQQQECQEQHEDEEHAAARGLFSTAWTCGWWLTGQQIRAQRMIALFAEPQQ